MAGRVQWEAQVDSNVAKLLSETKELRDQLDGIKKGNYEIKLNIDDKKLEKVISNLDKMLNSLGKGTGDFKEFENLSKQLNEIVSEVKELNKAFSGINDSAVSNLLSSIQGIDKSLSSLSEHITNVNKDFGSVGKNASDNVGQINEARKATEGLTEATKELANAQKNVGNKSNISSPIKDTFQGDKIEQATTSAKELDKTLESVEIPKESFDEVIAKFNIIEEKAKNIAKITRQDIQNSEGKYNTSYTVKYKDGSSEILDENSNPQLLRGQNVLYDAKQAEKEAKELLATQQQITKEAEKQTEAQQKKWQAFHKEQQDYVGQKQESDAIERNKSAYQELLNTIKQYSEVSKRIAKNETLDGDLELAQKLEDKISELQKQPILSSSQIAKSERELVNLYDQLETLEKKTIQKQNNQAAKEHAEVWEKNLKAIQEYMDANTKLNNLMAKDKGTGKYASDITLQEKEVEKLKEAAIEARATLSSMVNPHEAPVGDWNKWIEVMEKFKQATKGSAESVAKLEDALRSARNAQLSSIDTTINNGQSKLDEFSARKDQSDVYQNKLKELGDTLERLRTLKSSLSNTRAFTNEEEHQVDALTQSVHTFIKEISQMSADEKGSNAISRFKLLDKIADYMKKNTRMSREFKAELEDLMNILRTGGASVQVGEILNQFERVKDKIRQAKQEGVSFFDIFKNKVVYGFAARLAQYYLSFYDFIRYARYAVQSVIEFDTALTEMRKVSDESVSTLERLQKATFDLADGVGTTALELQKSIADFMRIGETLEDATKSAQDANVLFRVSEFDDVTQATDALVAMSAAYKDLEKSQINDVLNEIGNNYAISTDELASALQKSAATLSVAGNDIYEAAALVTAGNTVLQDADSVGTGLKMISLRILGTQEAKDELASLGEDVDDFVVQTKSKIDQTVRNYTAVTSNGFKGISVLDDNGNYRSTYEILRDISDVYQEIIETDKKAGTNRGQALLEVLAGKNRSNVAASILQAPEVLESAYESALSSAGSAQEELNKYLESADGKVQKLKNKLQEFWNVLLDSGTLKTIIGSLTTILEKATELVDTIGLLGTVGLGAGLFAGVKNFGKTYKCMVSNRNCFEYALHA